VIVFIDTSVLLRKLFGEPDPLPQWSEVSEAYASRLLPIEVGRAIDRARLAGDINDQQVEQLHSEARRVLASIDILALSELILNRAASPMPTVLGTLDSLHLATAMALADTLATAPVFATHDVQLARAARASGLDVVGA